MEHNQNIRLRVVIALSHKRPRSAAWRERMNERSLACLLVELDAELARKTDPHTAAGDILNCVEERLPGAVMSSAATLQLRSLGCPMTAPR